MRRLFSFLFMITFLMVVMISNAYSKPVEVTLSYDGGLVFYPYSQIAETSYSRDVGFAVLFSSPSEAFRLTSILIYGCYSYSENDTHKRSFYIEVRDSRLKLLKRYQFAYSEFFDKYFYPDSPERIPGDTSKWVSIPLNCTIPTKSFYVIVFTNSKNKMNALWIGTDGYRDFLGQEGGPKVTNSYYFEKGKIVKSLRPDHNYLIRGSGYPLHLIKVSLSGLPSDSSVVLKNETHSFSIGADEIVTFYAYNYSELSVSDEYIYVNENVRYVCEDPTQIIKGPGEIVFNFYPEYKVIVGIEPNDFFKYGILKVNGLDYRFPLSGWFEKGYNLSVSVPLEVGNEGQRYIFEGWSTGESKNYIVLTVDSPVSVYANYRTQYFVSVVSDFGNVEGEGWYDKGSKATIKVLETVIYGERKDARYVFSGWEPMGLTDPVLEVTVYEPMVIEAKWTTQYRVEVVSPYGDVIVSDDWVPEGGEVMVEVSPQSMGLIVKKVFSYWVDQDNNKYEDAKARIRINKPTKLTAVWVDDYTNLLIIIVVLIAVAFAIVFFVRKTKARKRKIKVIKISEI